MDVARTTASYIARKVSGKDSPGQVVLHVRQGSIRNPGLASGESLARLLQNYLPKRKFSGKIIINTGLGGLAHKDEPFVFV